MKKYLVLITSVVFISNATNAQKVISTAGKHLYGFNTSLNSTIGEPIIKTLTGTKSTLSQGFHQPGSGSICDLTAVITRTDVKCYSGNDGTATVTPSDGSPPYTYLWSDGQTAQSAINLVLGAYSVTVTDSNGCIVTDSVTIFEPTVLSLNVTVTDAGCNLSNGTATANVSGGTTPYSYLWNDPAVQITATATGLEAGIYSVTVTDSNGCSATALDTINVPRYTNCNNLKYRCYMWRY